MAKWGKVVFDDLIELQSKMQWLSRNQMQNFTRQCAREMAQLLYSFVIKKTPVDTGNLRRSWGIDMAVRRKGDVYEISIYNTAFYASYVEFGHRDRSHTKWVEGQFFLTKSEIELESVIDGILEQKLIQKLNEVFNGK